MYNKFILKIVLNVFYSFNYDKLLFYKFVEDLGYIIIAQKHYMKNIEDVCSCIIMVSDYSYNFYDSSKSIIHENIPFKNHKIILSSLDNKTNRALKLKKILNNNEIY